MSPKETINNILKSNTKVNIKLLGDSITHGVGGSGFAQNGQPITRGFARNPDGYCWAKLFKDYMEQKYDCAVTNNACTGTTIRFIIDRFEELVDGIDDIIICTIGTNDRHCYTDERDKPTKEEWSDRLYGSIVELYKMFKENNKTVIFMANIPASAENERDGVSGNREYWRVLHMDDVNAIYKKGQKELGFPLISMYDLFTDYCLTSKTDLNSLLADGLHPNNKGYDVMFNLIIKELCV